MQTPRLLCLLARQSLLACLIGLVAAGCPTVSAALDQNAARAETASIENGLLRIALDLNDGTLLELADVRRLNVGGETMINAIQFGFGPHDGEENFLKRLARQNGGQWAYQDISRLPD